MMLKKLLGIIVSVLVINEVYLYLEEEVHSWVVDLCM